MFLQIEHILHSDFLPHKACWMMRSDIITAHAFGDGLTALSYYLIPVILIVVARKFRLGWNVTFVFSVYATFIFLCGTTHVLDVVMIWYVDETILLIDSFLRVFTGIFSLFSAAVTFWAFKVFLTLVWQLFKVSKRVIDERANLGRATDDAIKEYNELYQKAKEYLQRRSDFQDEGASA